jgi:cytochrome c oxidase cbb3-type subunit 3
VPDPAVVQVLSQPGAMQEARRTFSIYCSECHGLAAGGGMGPPLTDPHTLYGGRYEDYIRIITHGSPNRPMPSWKAKLGEQRIRLIAAFVYALRGTGVTALPEMPPWSQ